MFKFIHKKQLVGLHYQISKFSSSTKPTPNFKPTYKTVHIMHGDDARLRLIQGIQKLALTAQKTLGPGGRNVALEYDHGDPKITKDGVTVIKSIHLRDRAQELGSKLLKKQAGSTNIYAGDGTTSSSILTKEILQLGQIAIKYEGAHPIALKKGLDIGVATVLKFLREISMPVTTETEILNVCNVSSNYNRSVAEIVAKTLNTVGLEGVINMTESPTGYSRFALVNGLVVERGFVSNLFVETDQREQQKTGKNTGELFCELEQPLVLVVADRITQVSEIAHILEIVKKQKRSFFLVSEDLQEQPLSTMVYNNQKDIIKCCAINMPWLANIQKEQLKDIAVMVGATLIDNEYGINLNEVQLKHFGSAKIIKTDENFTHIVGGNFNQLALEQRMDEIRNTIELEDSKHLQGVHKERLARMQAKIAEIQIGGGSDVERGEERDIIVDSLNSARSAMQHGVLPGGGVALFQASKLLDSGLPHLTQDRFEQIGVKILAKALRQPIKLLIENKTGKNAASIIEQIENSEMMFSGYDVKKECVCDVVDEGIVDSFAVVRTYLSDAVSLSGMLLTTETLVVKDKNYEPLSLKHYQDRKEFF